MVTKKLQQRTVAHVRLRRSIFQLGNARETNESKDNSENPSKQKIVANFCH